MAQVKTLKATSTAGFNRFLALVYLVMAVGMTITAVVAHSVSNNPELIKRIFLYPWFTFGLFLLQIIVVVWLSTAVMRMSPGAALLLFMLYSALTGLSLSSIFIARYKSGDEFHRHLALCRADGVGYQSFEAALKGSGG